MQTAIKRTVTVREGGLIELRSHELPIGATAEVIVLWETPTVDESDTWDDEDLRDATLYSLSRVPQQVDGE